MEETTIDVYLYAGLRGRELDFLENDYGMNLKRIDDQEDIVSLDRGCVLVGLEMCTEEELEEISSIEIPTIGLTEPDTDSTDFLMYFDSCFRFFGNESDRKVLANRIRKEVESKKTESEMKKKLRSSKEKIKKIHEISLEMMSVEEEEGVYDLAVEASERVLDFDICGIDIVEDGYLVAKAVSTGMPNEGYDKISTDDEGVAGNTYRKQESYLIGDVTEVEGAEPADPSYRSVISVPIGELGVFQAASEEKEDFDEEDVELAELLMSNVSEALQRIRYEKELKEERDRFEDLFETLKEQERELIEERDKFAALFENVPEAVVSLSFVDEDPIIEEVNPAFEDVFGYEREKLIGEPLDKHVVPPEWEEEANDINQRVLEGEKARREVRRRTSDGMRDFLLQVVPYTAGDQQKGYGVYTDITERKERQRRLQVLNRVLRHNLRNEMNVILGHAQLLKMDLDESESMEKAETIEKKAEEMTSLSDKAQQIEEAVGESGKTLRKINVVDVIERNLEHYDVKYPEVKMDYEIKEDEAWVKAEDQLSIAVSEVIENAIEHNDTENPELEVTVKSSKDIGNNQEEEYLDIKIADNGPGIPKQEREVLLEGRETPLHHGSGLGLWMVNWIINGSGGELVFDDNEPRGSVVKFRLPKSKIARAR